MSNKFFLWENSNCANYTKLCTVIDLSNRTMLCHNSLVVLHLYEQVRCCQSLSVSADPGEIVLGAWYLSGSVAILGRVSDSWGLIFCSAAPPFTDRPSVSGLAASLYQSTHGRRAGPALTTQSGHRLSENSWTEKILGIANSRAYFASSFSFLL